jgi:nucleoside-diphosphate-sugar epimerase
MKIALTGASGFVGKHTYRTLVRNGHTVVPIDRISTGYDREIILDFLEFDDCKFLEQIRDVQVIIHLANIVDFSDALKKDVFQVNVLSSLFLAQAAQNLDAQLIYVSTALVHGTYTKLINKAAEEMPDKPYNLSKWLAEKVAQQSCTKCSILRAAGIFGFAGPSHLRLNVSITKALELGIPPQVKGVGAAKRNYVYVKDVAETINYLVGKNKYETYYVAGKEILSIDQMAKSICDELLPGTSPTYLDGLESDDQIIEDSSELPNKRTFGEALKDIKCEYDENCGA